MATEPPTTLERMALRFEIEEFLYHEADLLDQRRYKEWLDLLADDIQYWMPVRRNVKYNEREREETNDFKEMNWFDEGKDILTQRVRQIETGIHWAEEPASRVTHMVSNIRLTKATPDEVEVSCRFLVYRNRVTDETDFFVGKREDLLRKVDGEWKIAKRKLTLDQNVLLAKSVTVML